jgi:hypothetical protein
VTARAAVATGLLIVAAAAVSFRGVYEPDLCYHLAQGREVLSGHIIRTNLFSFSYSDYRQHYTSWLFDATAYSAWRMGGGAAVQALQFCLITLTLFCLYRASRIRAPASAAFAVVALSFFVIEPRAIPRPHLGSFAALAACVWLVERAVAARSSKPLVATVPLIALWSNFHVECVFGVALLAVFAASELIRPAALPRREALRTVGIVVLCALAMLANPYGIGILRYLYENWSVPQILDIAELRPPRWPTYRAFYAYLAIAGLLIASQPRQLATWEIAAGALFVALGIRYVRLTPLVVLVTAPIVAARLGALTARGVDGRAVVVVTLVAAFFLSRVPPRMYAQAWHVGTEALTPRAFFSDDAVAYMRANGLGGPVFNSMNLGGWLAWTMYPHARIFQDSRLQAYPPEHFLRIMDAAETQEGWNALVQGVDWAVISVPRRNNLSGYGMFPAAEWATVFSDDAVEIIVRRSGRHGHLAR